LKGGNKCKTINSPQHLKCGKQCKQTKSPEHSKGGNSPALDVSSLKVAVGCASGICTVVWYGTPDAPASGGSSLI
jgi:hypothetical protein